MTKTTTISLLGSTVIGLLIYSGVFYFFKVIRWELGAVVSLLFVVISYKIIKEALTEKQRKKKEVFSQQKRAAYGQRIIRDERKAADILERYFKNVKKVNILICGKKRDLSYNPHILLVAVDAINFIAVRDENKTASEIVSSFSKITENNLPSFAFIDIGKYDHQFNIDSIIRTLKKEHPAIIIFVVCSYLYSEDKAGIIERLIADFVVEKAVFSDILLPPLCKTMLFDLIPFYIGK